MIEILFFIALLLLGYIFGRRSEKRHYRSIIEREEALRDLPAIASRFPPKDAAYRQQLVQGNVVVASDFFKTFLAGLINLFGGSVVSYEALLDRARREALLRMKAEAQKQQAQLIFNVKFETTTIGEGRARSVEVLAYGTALTPANTGSVAAAL